MDARSLMLYGGSTLSGIGNALKMADADKKGFDDLGGLICTEGGLVLMKAGLNQLRDAHDAVELLRDGCDQ